MIHTDTRKLQLAGWLKEHGNVEYQSPLKLQKFLLLYEIFTKVDKGVGDFSHLKGYKRGPVFSQTWGDYTYERTAFDRAAEKAFEADEGSIDEERAKRSLFIVSILSENELSDLTHQLDLWKTKENRIMQGEQQVELEEEDFSQDDAELVALLEAMYPNDLIENSRIVSLDNHYFLFSKQDAARLTEQHYDTLGELAEKEHLHNPVYVELDEEGRLIVD